MKKYLFYLFFVTFFVACDDLNDKTVSIAFPENTNEIGRLFVLSEGLYNQNNSTLCCIDFTNRTIETNFFEKINKRGLGDTANDMKRYGNQLWIVVNGSSQIEIINLATGKSLKQILLIDNGKNRLPRYVTYWEGKAYVCCFDGTVAQIDTTSLEVEDYLTCGRNPDGIGAVNGKLYISNSGGLDFPTYDSTVSVIDLATKQEIKKINVGINPYKLEVDNEGDVYVVSRGNNLDIKPKWYRIDSKSDEVVQIFNDLPVVNFVIHNDTAYLYNFDFVTNDYWIKSFNCKTEQIIRDHFITDDTVIERPYSIYAHPVNGNIYITDAKNYTSNGDLFCFDKNGKLRYDIKGIGLNPNAVLVVP